MTRWNASDDAIVMAALLACDARRPGDLHSVRTNVRPLAELTKDRFDAACLRLAEVGEIVLHYHDYHDYPYGESDEAREGLVHDTTHNVYYVGIAVRRCPPAPERRPKTSPRSKAKGLGRFLSGVPKYPREIDLCQWRFWTMGT